MEMLSIHKLYLYYGGASKTELNIDNNHLITDSQTVINGITTVSEIGLNGKAKTIFDSSGGANVVQRWYHVLPDCHQ
jgi:hypothetical protein